MASKSKKPNDKDERTLWIIVILVVVMALGTLYLFSQLRMV